MCRMKKHLLELRSIVLDKPTTALETSVWWTEYVLRHKDLSHLRSASFDQNWIQRRLIDVWAFLFSIVLVSAILLVWVSVVLLKFGARAFVSSYASISTLEHKKKE